MTKVAATVVSGWAALWVATGDGLNAAALNARTLETFDRYVRLTEARMERQLSGKAPFLPTLTSIRSALVTTESRSSQF